MKSVIDKKNLAKVIAGNMTRYEQPELFIEWANRESTTMDDVLKYASEQDIKECQEKYNEVA